MAVVHLQLRGGQNIKNRKAFLVIIIRLKPYMN